MLEGPLGGSPKFHDHVVMVPVFGVEISVKLMLLVSHTGVFVLKLLVGRSLTVIVPDLEAGKQIPVAVTV